MASRRTDCVRANIFVNGTVVEQASNFKYLGYSVSYNTSNNDAVSYTHLDVYKRQVHDQ